MKTCLWASPRAGEGGGEERRCECAGETLRVADGGTTWRRVGVNVACSGVEYMEKTCERTGETVAEGNTRGIA